MMMMRVMMMMMGVFFLLSTRIISAIYKANWWQYLVDAILYLPAEQAWVHEVMYRGFWPGESWWW